MTEGTPQNKWSKLNDVTVIEAMLIDKHSEHWNTCHEYIQYIVKTKFGNLSPDFQQDAIQEGMLSVHKNLATFRRDCKLTSWLTTVAKNNAITQIRRQKDLQLREVHSESSSESPDDEIGHPALSTSKSPEEIALTNERIRETFAMLEDFLKPSNTSEGSKAWSDRNREILQMVLIDGESQEKTAQALGIPAPNIGYMVRAVRTYLSQKLS
ncbi:MAG: hypothetical protein PVS3B3_28670 [Ktedonobacteraceae bacterium]